ncbi:hypothetical protein COT47_03690, partial [Candidatus Woesearchaeota archaeon CG08_land_8_20_14_0_20_43_7]
DTKDLFNVTVRWYNQTILALSEDYNNSYSSGTLLNATLASANTTRGETWYCSVIVTDGINATAWTDSNNLSILNSIPTQGTPILNSTYGTNHTNENLTVYPQNIQDADGDYIWNITTWYINGESYPTLYLPFEGGSLNGTSGSGISNATKDYSSSDRNVTNYNSIWSSSGGYGGSGAFDFNSTRNTYLKVPDDPTFDFGTGGFTMMAWVKTPKNWWTTIIYRSVIDKSSGLAYSNAGDADGPAIAIGSDSRVIGMYDNIARSTDLQSSAILGLNKWYHIVMVYDPDSGGKLYVNGTLVDTSTNISTNNNNIFNLTIGSSEKSLARIYNGTIDEVMIFNRSLSAEQIFALYINRTDMIVSEETKIGDVWKACTTPNDGTDDGTMICSDELTIVTTPPTVTLESPVDGYNSTNATMFFNCSATDAEGLKNMTLWGNWSGWHANQTVALAGTSNSIIFTVDFVTNGSYTWNCIVNDTEDETDWGTNRTFEVDTADYNITYVENSIGTTVYGYRDGVRNQTDYDFHDRLLRPAIGYNNGTFISQIIDIVNASDWKNMTWAGGMPYGDELPDLGGVETTIDGIDMSDNVLLLHLDETSGIVVDSSGNGKDCTNNGATYNYGGKFNRSMNFTDDHLSVPSSVTDGLSAFTVSFWINTTESRAHGNFYERPTMFGQATDGSSTNDFAITTNNGYIGMWHGLNSSGGDGVYLSTTTQINDALWHHIAVSYNGAAIVLYVDGIEEASLYADDVLNNRAFFIGALNDIFLGEHADHNGFYDEFAIWDSAFSEQDIKRLYARGKAWMRMSVRSCDDDACDTEPWAQTFTTNGIHTLTLTPDRYIQYKTELFTEDPIVVAKIHNVTIGYEFKTDPEIASVIVNSSYGTNYTIENLTAYPQGVTDADGDSVKNITNWYMANATQDLTSIMILNMPFEAWDTNSTGHNENNATVDYSGYGNNGTAYNITWLPEGGHDGWGAYRFETNGQITIPDDPTLEIRDHAFSITYWVNSTNKGYQFPIHKGANSKTDEGYMVRRLTSGAHDFIVANGTRYFWNFTSTKYPLNTSDVSDGKWHFVAFVLDPDTGYGYAYKDAVLKSSVFINDTTYDIESDDVLTIGGKKGVSDYRFNGTLDNIMFYNRSLSAAQILALYHNRTDLIVSDETTMGETWQACVTPNDGYVNGDMTCSNNVTLVNRPPVATLESPVDGYNSTNVTMFFNCSAIDPDGLKNITLFGNWSGWHANQTAASGGTANSTTFTVNLIANGSYTWNCFANDTEDVTDWGTNRTFEVDTADYNITYLKNSTTTFVYGYKDGIRARTDYDFGTGYMRLAYDEQNGTFISQIFDAGSITNWRNITWTPGIPYGVSLPENETDEENIGGMNMINNILLINFEDFQFDDDFESGEINPARWGQISANLADIENGKL